MQVREYQHGDFDKFIDMWLELGLGNSQRGDDEKVIEFTISLGAKFFVLCDNDKIIGTSWVTTDGRRLFLHHFGICKDYQGQKLSYLLLNESLNFAKQINQQIKLEVHHSNQKAINLYKKAGFDYLGDYDVYIIRDLDKIKPL
jgi:ribosomal protein S18 acetylase RimI-like enzyme